MIQDTANAESVAISALSYLAANPELLNRFLAITGIELGQLRQAAAETGFLAGILDFILAHEPTLLSFAEAADLAPAALIKARRALPNGSDDYDRSI